MFDRVRKILDSERIESSAPCRIDMGGTLDISTFYYPLRHLHPCTFNMAVDLRTRVRLLPYTRGRIKISSKGFESAEFAMDEAPFDHPLGLMFSVAGYFRAEGVHIIIDSSSPPRSALGGSSAAAVALVALFSRIFELQGAAPLSEPQIAMLAHELEESVAGVPCGLQDQLAAVYGGVNAWYWPGRIGEPPFKREAIFKEAESLDALRAHVLLAYCGIPHESKNINGIWVKQFISGATRGIWIDIVSCTKKFIDALKRKKFFDAVQAMNQEVNLRKQMTPDVFDEIGDKLVTAALANECGARFTGAGGGGCIWALGETFAVSRLRTEWEAILQQRKDARFLDVTMASEGVSCSI